MIHFQTGDILKTKAEALVNTVNCVGVMGRGVALQFKRAFPENFKAYKSACQRDEVHPGRMLVFKTGYVDHPRYIINFPTKRHWRGRSRLEDITAGLGDLVRVIADNRIQSIALPPLGSGLGGLDWRVVRKQIQQALSALPDVEITVFEPRKDDEPAPRAAKAPTMTPGRAALVGLIRQYLDALMDPFVTLLEVHKLMYFMQEAGEPLKLRYAKAPYGPYAENLSHVLRDVEGYLVTGYRPGDQPDLALELVPRAAEDAKAFLDFADATRERMGRVTKLVEGYETPFGLELLSTVHWLASREQNGADRIVTATYAWNDRKRQFSELQITSAFHRLEDAGWLPTSAPSEGTSAARR